MPASMARFRFGVGANQNTLTLVFDLCKRQHLGEGGSRSARMGDRSIPLRLVDHQDIAGGRGLKKRIEVVVFAELVLSAGYQIEQQQAAEWPGHLPVLYSLRYLQT